MLSKPSIRKVDGPCLCEEPKTRKSVIAQFMVARALAKAGLSNPSYRDDLEQLSRHLTGVNQSSMTSMSGVDIETHLTAVVDSAARYFVSIQKNDEAVALNCDKSLRHELAEVLQSSSCLSANSELVHYIDELFDLVIAWVEASYSEMVPGGLLGGVDVGLKVTGSASAEAVGATTRFPKDDTAKSRRAQVTLAVNADNFGEYDAFSLVALIFHEVFVHCVQALGLASKREPFGSDCPLSEGLVDSAGKVELLRHLSHGVSDSWAASRYSLRQAVEQKHFSRFAAAPGNPTNAERRNLKARQLGQQVFERLAMEWPHEDRSARATTLALKLNLSDLDRDERRTIVDKIYIGLGGSAADAAILWGRLNAIVDGKLPAIAIRELF